MDWIQIIVRGQRGGGGRERRGEEGGGGGRRGEAGGANGTDDWWQPRRDTLGVCVSVCVCVAASETVMHKVARPSSNDQCQRLQESNTKLWDNENVELQ